MWTWAHHSSCLNLDFLVDQMTQLIRQLRSVVITPALGHWSTQQTVVVPIFIQSRMKPRLQWQGPCEPRKGRGILQGSGRRLQGQDILKQEVDTLRPRGKVIGDPFPVNWNPKMRIEGQLREEVGPCHPCYSPSQETSLTTCVQKGSLEVKGGVMSRDALPIGHFSRIRFG